ncbi:TetR family transcriptional regulator [Aureimonas frigidaquae]|uniref:TetR family transcriptional regulator n=1 Tax=Aureimonas frigidaquae TaxID=424757 RepID=UPI00078189A8|nr:TetR family transcriptional regulator [Aureimonas frigidaquae]
MRRTKQEAAETREAILDAAETVFFERGVSQTSLNQIAAAAGVTRGAIYWHFSNKSDLFRAMCDRAHLPQEEFFKASALLDSEDPIGALRDFTIATFDRFMGDQRARRVFTIILLRCEYVGEMEEALCVHREDRMTMRRNVEAIFERAVRNGTLGQGWTAEAATNAYICILIGLFGEWLKDECGFDLGRIGRLTMDSLFNSMQVRATTP